MKTYLLNHLTIGNGETIAYRRTGGNFDTGKPTIVLIHGNMSSSVHWQTTMEQLEAVGYSVVAPDLRGFGESSYEQSFDSLAELASDVQALIHELALESMVLVGWSLGGGVALELATQLSGKVKQVVTLGSVPVTGYPIYAKDTNGQPILTERYTTKEQVASDPVQVVPMLSAIESQNRDFIQLVLSHSLYALKKPAEAEFEAYTEAVFKQRCLVDANHALLKFNFESSTLPCPLHMIHGGLDAIVPLAWAQASADAIGEYGKLIVLDGMAHSFPTEDMKRFINTLTEVIS